MKVEKNSDSYENALKIMAKKFTMSDIDVNRKIFRSLLVPSYCDFVMTRSTPFRTRDEEVLAGLQRIWDKVFPDDAQKLTMDCPIKYVVSYYHSFYTPSLYTKYTSLGRSTVL